MKNPAPGSAYLGWLSTAMQADDGDNRSGPAADLVLGYATGYDASMIAPFVRSLRHVFDGPAALVVDDRPDVVSLLKEHAIDAVHPEGPTGWVPHPVMARFSAYSRLLARWPNAANVLLTDVRDVLFQADPFNPRADTLEAFAEGDGEVLRDHDFNMKYLRSLVGEEMTEALADKPCLCVGTLLGPRDQVDRFCRTLLMLAAIPRSEIGGAFGTDQAACNVAIHLRLVKAEVKPNFGRVATLGLTPSRALRFEAGRVINPDGGVSAIVHQHDRHSALAAAVHEHWGQGMQHHERVQPKTTADRGRKLKQSLMRRMPELR